jgi:hypothetical protein
MEGGTQFLSVRENVSSIICEHDVPGPDLLGKSSEVVVVS